MKQGNNLLNLLLIESFQVFDIDNYRCSAVENLVQSISQDPLGSEQAQMLVQCLHAIFVHDLSTTPLLIGPINPE